MTPDATLIAAVPDWDTLCAEAVTFLNNCGDPFCPQVMIVPRPAHGRALAQHLARRLGGPDGVCMGIDFLSAARFRHRLESQLLGIDIGLDPWRTRGLGFAVLDLLHSCQDEPWFVPLLTHLDLPGEQRPGRYLATATRIARLFRSYRDRSPDLLRAWSSGESVDITGTTLSANDLWQPELWRRLSDYLSPYDDPLARARRLSQAVLDAPNDALPLKIGVVSTTGLTSDDLLLYEALAHKSETKIWQLLQILPASSGSGSPLARRYGVVERASSESLISRKSVSPSRSSSLLATVQAEIRSDHPPSNSAVRTMDGSIQIHACHGPDRQVEVLREVLCDLFECDPTLEPRDVVVICPDLDTYAPLITANFCLPDSPHLHPGHQLRVQISAESQTSANPVLKVVAAVLSFEISRADASSLIDLISAPPVAHRFGFSPDDLARLSELIAEANICWGVDSSSRTHADLSGVTQGTWFVGLDRMLAGVALDSYPPTSLERITPLDHIGSTEIDLIGALSEIVSRVRKSLLEFSTPTTAYHWTQRLREVIDLFVSVPEDQIWQLNHAHSELSAIADAAVDRSAVLTTSDIRVLVTQLLQPHRGRTNSFTGSLLVVDLDEVHAIPHKVVCLLGVDDDHFPPKVHHDGDDLTLRTLHGIAPMFDTRLLARQYLLDAILAARDTLIVITQGADPRTNTPLAAPIPVLDLLKSCAITGPAGQWRAEDNLLTGTDSLVRHHSLQNYGWSNFITVDGAMSFSFDVNAAKGAHAQHHPIMTLPAPWEWIYPSIDEQEVQLNELISFYQNPASSLLNLHTGIPRTVYRSEIDNEIPIELDALQQFRVADRLVQLMVSGAEPLDADRIVSLSGLIPPGKLGRKVMSSVLGTAQAIAETVRHVRDDSSAKTIAIDVTVGSQRLVGQVHSFNSVLTTWGYGRLKGSHLIASWLSLLAAAATYSQPFAAALIKNEGTTLLDPPPSAAARDLLGQLMGLRTSGLRQVLPLPIETSAAFAGVIMNRYARNSFDAARQAWRYESAGWSHFFNDFDDLLHPPPHPDDPVFDHSSNRFMSLATWLWKPVRRAIRLEVEPGWWR